MSVIEMCAPQQPFLVCNMSMLTVRLRWLKLLLKALLDVFKKKYHLRYSMFVGVVALRYQHYTNNCSVDNGVPQLPQT